MFRGYDSHGLVECLPLDLDEEVDGVSIELAVGTYPEVLLYDETVAAGVKAPDFAGEGAPC